MTTDWKALCAQLAENVRYLLDCVADGDSDPVAIAECVQHLGATRAALSQPEPEGPTEEDILELSGEHFNYRGDSMGGWFIPISIGPTIEPSNQVHAFARAVLARWGK